MSKLASTYLEFVAGSSAKFYRVSLLTAPPDFVALAEWGRIGTNGQSIEKYRGPNRAAAETAVNKALAAKRAEGYLDRHDPSAGASSTGTPAGRPAPLRSGTAGPAAARGAGPVGPKLDAIMRFPAQAAGENGNLAAAIAAPSRYVIEEKFDGFRALVAMLPGGRIEIRNRYGEVKGRQGPQIVAALAELGKRIPALYNGTILDGEIAGATWNQTMVLLASGADGNIYHVFDLPVQAGVDLRPLPLRDRLVRLDALLTHLPAGTVVRPTPRSVPRPGIVEAIWAAGGEGIIIKDLGAAYISGDRSSWTKVKQTQTDEAVITGFEPGKGKYANTIGAVILSQYRNGTLVEVCRVSGMRDDVRRSLNQAWIGKVVEFAFQMRTAGSYRHPRWLRPRPDKRPADCLWKG
jgi:predicted DNA-binding WGR domain protein